MMGILTYQLDLSKSLSGVLDLVNFVPIHAHLDWNAFIIYASKYKFLKFCLGEFS